jgi:precorrin-4/cobalt-precorrin-4 C11-methyltransferase
MGIFLSGAHPDELQAELLAPGSGYDPETPAAIAVRVSWPDERLVSTTVGHLATELRRVGATRTVLVLVGPVLGAPTVPARSHVYSPSYGHRFRAARTG